jgi:flagellar protein FliO/FliZ
MGELVIRLVFSLAVVLGLLLLCVKFAGRRFQGKGDALVRVVHRQALSRSASVSVVNVAGRVLVLGTTEHQVRLLTELDEDVLDALEADLDDDFEKHLDMELDRDLGDDAEPVGHLEELSPALALVIEEQPRQSPGARRTPARKGGTRPAEKSTPLTGSMLSPSTWRQAWSAVSGRAS